MHCEFERQLPQQHDLRRRDFDLHRRPHRPRLALQQGLALALSDHTIKAHLLLHNAANRLPTHRHRVQHLTLRQAAAMLLIAELQTIEHHAILNLTARLDAAT